MKLSRFSSVPVFPLDRKRLRIRFNVPCVNLGPRMTAECSVMRKYLVLVTAFAVTGLGGAAQAATLSYTDTYTYEDHRYSGSTVRRRVADGVVIENTTSAGGFLRLLDAPGFDETLGTLTGVDLWIDYEIPWRVTSQILGFDETVGGDVTTTVSVASDFTLRGIPNVLGVGGATLINRMPLGTAEETSVCEGVAGENCTQQNNFALTAGSPVSASFNDPADLFYFGGRYSSDIRLTTLLVEALSTETSSYVHFGGTVPAAGTASLDPPSITLRTTFHYTPAVVPLPAAAPLFLAGLSLIGFLGWRKRRW